MPSCYDPPGPVDEPIVIYSPNFPAGSELMPMDYVAAMIRNLLLVAAWTALIAIIFMSLSPIGLRPETGHAGPERFVAYSVLGTLFMSAYPRHFTGIMIFVLTVAVSLELAQHLTPDRHGHLADVLEKFGGGVAGCSLTRLVQILRRP